MKIGNEVTITCSGFQLQVPICAKYVHIIFKKKYKIFNVQNSETTNLKITTIIYSQFLIKRDIKKDKTKNHTAFD